MVARDHFHKQEVAERQAARADSKRSGNYRSDPWRTREVRRTPPYNCYGCRWEPQGDEFVLKFTHKLCYPNHVPEEPAE